MPELLLHPTREEALRENFHQEKQKGQSQARVDIFSPRQMVLHAFCGFQGEGDKVLFLNKDD